MVASPRDEPRPARGASEATPVDPATAVRRQLETIERHHLGHVLLVTGPGGSGKTHALDIAAQVGEERRWITGYSSLADISVRDAVAMAMIRAVRTLYERRPGSPTLRPLSRVAASLSPDLADLVPFPVEPMRTSGVLVDDLRACMRRIDTLATDMSEAGLSIQLDDAHSADPTELDALVTVATETALQTIPVAFVIGGLPTLVAVARRQPPESYLVARVAPLDVRASAVVVQAATAQRRVKFEAEALAVLAKAAGGNPLLLQFMAEATIAEQDRLDPSHISARHAQMIARAGWSAYERAVLLPGYADLLDSNQRYLRAVATFGGPAPVDDIAQLVLEDAPPAVKRSDVDIVMAGLLRAGWIATEDFKRVDFAYPRSRQFVSALDH